MAHWRSGVFCPSRFSALTIPEGDESRGNNSCPKTRKSRPSKANPSHAQYKEKKSSIQSRRERGTEKVSRSAYNSWEMKPPNCLYTQACYKITVNIWSILKLHPLSNHFIIFFPSPWTLAFLKNHPWPRARFIPSSKKARIKHQWPQEQPPHFIREGWTCILEPQHCFPSRHSRSLEGWPHLLIRTGTSPPRGLLCIQTLVKG